MTINPYGNGGPPDSPSSSGSRGSRSPSAEDQKVSAAVSDIWSDEESIGSLSDLEEEFSHSPRSAGSTQEKRTYSLDEKEKAAASIQAVFKGHLVRTQQEKENAAVTIQTAYRAYAARSQYNSMRIEKFLSYLKEKEVAFSNTVRKIQTRILDSVHKKILNFRDYSTVMGDLEKIRQDFSRLIKDVKTYSGSLPDMKYIDFKEMYQELVDRINECMHGLSEKVGFSDLHTGMDFLRPNWNEEMDSETRLHLGMYNKVFEPTAYTMLDVDYDEEASEYIFTDSMGMEETIDASSINNEAPVVTKSHFHTPSSMYEKMYGAEIIVPLKDEEGALSRAIVFRGHFREDPLKLHMTHGALGDIFNRFEEAVRSTPVSEEFKRMFLLQYSLNKMLTETPSEFEEKLISTHRDAQRISGRPLAGLMREFVSSSTEKQVEMLSLLLMNEDDTRGFFLFDMVGKDSPEYKEMLRLLLPDALKRKLNLAEESVEEMREKVKKMDVEDVPIETRILASQMDDIAKAKAIERAKASKGMGGEGPKASAWVNGLLKVPFGKHSSEPVPPLAKDATRIEKEDHKVRVREYLDKAKGILDDAVHGHEKPKRAIMHMLAQRCARNESGGGVLGIQGPPGNGKTTLVKEGVAKAMDRPFVFISLGNINDGSLISGERYAYVGSHWGRIIDALMEAGSMDPIIYIDELDKVSQTEKGREVISALIHLTDPAQNAEYQDNYFDGIYFNLSKAMIVFSYNDESLINPVLKDRIKKIHTEPLSPVDKVVVSRDYLIPKVIKEVGFADQGYTKDDFIITDEDLGFIIENYTMEAGARGLGDHLFTIFREMIYDYQTEDGVFPKPFTIDRDYIIRCLEEPRLEFTKIGKHPQVGMVNGLYATRAGTGGLTIIQTTKGLSDRRLELTLTGSQGDVMKESMQVAKNVAWNLIPKSRQDEIREEVAFSLNIHCPDTAMPKDGPSAGGAITSAIVSRLMDIPIRNNVAMTGEIDSLGNISKIGGLRSKLNGAKRAGVNFACVPRDNLSDVEKILKEDEGLITRVRNADEVSVDDLDAETDAFEVIIVDTIDQLLKCTLIRNDVEFQTLS